MQSHRGLPKKLPMRKNKAKIYSPAKNNNQSPLKSDQSYRPSPFKTPQRQSSSSHSQHRIGSKQKPSLRPPSLSQSPRYIPEVTKFVQVTQKQNVQQKTQQVSFRQNVFGLMGNFARKFQNKQPNLSKANINKNIMQTSTMDYIEQSRRKQIQQNKRNNKPQCIVIGPNLGYSTQPAVGITDQQILERCQYAFQYQNYALYCGQKINNKRSGYGIQYFKSKDKFMGNFRQDKAQGHGTFYLYDIGKRILAIWSNNQIVLENSYIIEKF